MRIGVLGSVVCAALLGTGAAWAQPAFDPHELKGPHAGRQNEVLVLGTPHLSGLPATFRPAALATLIDALAGWKPEAIAVEEVSGAQCDFMRHYPARYRDSVEAYCWDTAPARAATGLDVPAATEAVSKALQDWPQQPSAAQRRHLAALFLAAGEPASGLVQWLRLAPEDRHAGDGLDAALVRWLDGARTERSEVMQIAAPLAARLGLERLYAMDDHTADSPVDDEKAYGAAIEKAWDNPATARIRTASDTLHKHIDTPAGVMDLYRADNAPAMGRLTFDSDFGAALEEPSPQKYGRQYVGYWETRNLRMASNIRDMFANRPGIRGLVIVGASHRAYLNAYLDEMHDMRVVPSQAVLR